MKAVGGDRFGTRRSRQGAAVLAVALAAALLGAPAASGNGDPVQKGKLALKLSGGFKEALKRNGVSLRPKRLAIKPGSSLVDPLTGASELRLKGKLTAKGHGEKVVAHRLNVSLEDQGGILRGHLTGALKGRRVGLFRLRAGPPGSGVTRSGWGAKLAGIRAKISRRFAVKLNRALGLHSLHGGQRAARASISQQPQTVQVTGGYFFIDIPIGYVPASTLFGSGTDTDTIAAKLPAHCVGPIISVQVIPGPDPNNPARLTNGGLVDPVLGRPPLEKAAIFRFPVVGGSVGPDGKTGALQLEGGIRVLSGASGIDAILFADYYGADCAMEPVGLDTSNSVLDSEWDRSGFPNIGPDLTHGRINSYVTLRGQDPGCTFADGGPVGCGLRGTAGPGFKGNAVGQLMDLSVAKVSADPNAHTVTIDNIPVVNNGLAATTFNQLFERTELFPNGGQAPHSPEDFAYGDKFGVAHTVITTR